MLRPRTSRCGTVVGIGGRSALGLRGLISTPRGIGCSASSDDDAAPTLNQDWRSFRARMVLQERDIRNQGATKPKAQEHDNLKLLQEQNPALAKEGVWAHALPTPEVGCVLLATQQAPELLGNRWWQLVILLVEHGDKGSVGLLLNRPSVLTLNRKVINTLSSGSGAIPLQQLQTFSDAQLYCGGFSGQQTLHIMHGHAGLDGAVEVVPGVYLGGHKAAADAVLTRGLDPSHFRFFLGTMVWGPGQLHKEIQKGAWACAACARSLVLKQCLELPVPLWKEILKLMGGQYHNDVDGD